MRVLVNGRDVGALDRRLERRLTERLNDRTVEAVAISPADSVLARRRQVRTMMIAAVSVTVFTLIVVLGIVSTRAPFAIAWLIPVFVLATLVTCGIAYVVFDQMLRAHQRRIDARLPPQLAPGATVRVDPASLSVGGQTWPWSALTVEELGLREWQGSETRMTAVDQLTLNDGARRISLDALFLTNGRAVLAQAWLRLRAAGQG
jgi:hypothetical protein